MAGTAVAVGEASSEKEARDLFERLTELWPEVDAAPPDERPQLAKTWSDARLDLIYVLSGGTAPASLTLGHRLPRS